MNYKTNALTTEQYTEIIETMKQGFTGFEPNERIATALVLEGNLGLRISDILRLRLADIVKDGDRYRLAIVEQKTGKERVFTVPFIIQQYLENYALRNGIGRTELLFPITERAVQKQLHLVCDYLGYECISTHSFRKWYATEIYRNNGYDVALVQRLLQHSSSAITQRYPYKPANQLQVFSQDARYQEAQGLHERWQAQRRQPLCSLLEQRQFVSVCVQWQKVCLLSDRQDGGYF
jgi:integrase